MNGNGPAEAAPLFSILCGIQGCPVRLTATNNRKLCDMQWHHMVGVHDPEFYKKQGFTPPGPYAGPGEVHG